MLSEHFLTHCLSSDRKPLGEIRRQARYFSDQPFLKQLTDALSDIVLVLNEDRQIVLANRALLEGFDLREEEVLGFRPGETLDCIHAFESHGGCGTTEFCKTCGAAMSLHACRQGNADMQECRISRRNNIGALDLKVRSIPIAVRNEKFVIFVITDISHEKRRRALERIFFHDILNMAGNVRGLADLMESGFPEKRAQYADLLVKSADMLTREIHAQRDLSAAENNELPVHFSPVDSAEILARLVSLYQHHRVAGGRQIRIDDTSPKIAFTSDRTLLMRVLGNMMRNALEAAAPDETVTIGCEEHNGDIHFRVHNPGVIPHETQLRIFQRSFSTKGRDRGLGTYSMKLLSERYLRGRVFFVSSRETGTVFAACYPLSPDSDTSECPGSEVCK
ncbi:sensor histidine kinase [Desulfonema ishimotonii]|uniref:histidine kinase n=1 Tax=Desulfonema ishimotonii TaxID=45657 RepID=A0A401FVZ4_9BACT|nr:ATP-binding protein [Desulfonema ishimotonii]GBC61123.1 sensor histidine kinase [Desulfonema ishimotonii]